MPGVVLRSWRRGLIAGLAVGFALCAAPAAPLAGTGDGSRFAAHVQQLSFDPFTNPTSQHRTQVEPGSFSYRHRVVTAFQTGRFFNGGGSDIGWATSLDGGGHWRFGFMPGLTTHLGGTATAVTDASVAYDAADHTWLVLSVLLDATPRGVAVVVNRSRDGLHWESPITVSSAGPGQDWDKTWIACDNHRESPFYGHCYAQFDNFAVGDQMEMSTSTDGGRTWGPTIDAAPHQLGFAGQPVVQPNGTVIVPFVDFLYRSMLSLRSTDGGVTWSAAVPVNSVTYSRPAGNLRDAPFPSAAVDARGRVYLVWQDCRFRPACTANDLVMSTSDDGLTWSPPARIPISPVDSGADYFIPGLAVKPNTAGDGADLALDYYYYPSANCTAANCQLSVGLISSPDGGADWGQPRHLAGPMSLSWLASTSQGVMVGDYIATSFVGETPLPFFSLARAPSNGRFHEAIYTASSGDLGFSDGLVHAQARGGPSSRVAVRPQATAAVGR